MSVLASEIMNLHQKIQPLEEEIADLKATNADTLKGKDQAPVLSDKMSNSDLMIFSRSSEETEFKREATARQ